MPIHTPDGGATYPEYLDLDRKLREGDGIMWTGDPRLFLGVGVMEEVRNGRKTGKVGRRLEVWRTNEDGSETMVGHWHPSDQYRVLYDLAQMRVESPNHVSVEDRIDNHNAALQEEADRAAREQIMETLEHALRLDHDRHNPRNRFYMNGRGDRGGRA